MYLAKKQGPFATLGLAEDTWASNEHVIERRPVHRAMPRHRPRARGDVLRRARQGAARAVRLRLRRHRPPAAHVLARHRRPTTRPGPSSRVLDGRNVIDDLYRRMDDLVGKTMAKCAGDDTLLMVISDHGFGPFRRGIDLNRWLEENGYLDVDDGRRDEEHLAGVDWSRTRAFAIGLTASYINLKDKYSQGIVEPGAEADRLREEIAERLDRPGRSDENGESAVKRVYIASQVLPGPVQGQRPRPDPRLSARATASRGRRPSAGRPTRVFHDNTKAWSGDHCVDPSLVPGHPVLQPADRDARTRGCWTSARPCSRCSACAVPEYMDGKAADRGRARREAGRKPRAQTAPRSDDDGRIRERRSADATLLKGAAAAAAAGAAGCGVGGYWLGSGRRVSRSAARRSSSSASTAWTRGCRQRMMKAGQLPNLAKLRGAGGFSDLGTSMPPQSPVAWANFINGAGPGSHGIFDFIHRHPAGAVRAVLLRRRDPARRGRLGDRRPPAPARLLAVQPQAAADRAAPAGRRRSGTTSTPRACRRRSTTCRPTTRASPSQHGHHRCLCGMGTPDMLGTYGTYQYFAEDGPETPLDEGGGKRSSLTFDNETATRRDRRPGEQPAQDAGADRRSSSSSTATARPTRP